MFIPGLAAEPWLAGLLETATSLGAFEQACKSDLVMIEYTTRLMFYLNPFWTRWA